LTLSATTIFVAPPEAVFRQLRGALPGKAARAGKGRLSKARAQFRRLQELQQTFGDCGRALGVEEEPGLPNDLGQAAPVARKDG
jgi:hypothetical protein